ncbi:hypothetical protein TVNIR_0309 [Thioalkalivibrio nitratireducens DSM 14787]|uniref:Uncharacterized protein n=1 Tax=Thioalkalivibrio nitratireducens (strain DSM 14787 / UNIQEM 213 / ALEN2) TaxID=1255043 RepID=L0DSQ6_THIND|nr:NusG domain II-containing protein [Thioalkalivibrio nitratireducens]AGA32020.1 hypothetical protein TVNIR_0309 [Thioalkalivibrio nitratireducens DSM 14787]
MKWGLRWGDGLMIALATAGVTASFLLVYSPVDPAQTGPVALVVTQAGVPERQYPLDRDRGIRIEGVAGVTEVEIRAGRARCLRSPGSQGICEGAGWLERPGDLAVSLPNRLVLQVAGSRPAFDSMHY